MRSRGISVIKQGGRLTGAVPRNHSFGGLKKDFQVKPGRAKASILQIETHHIVESNTATSINLPQSGDARLRLEQTTAMPCFIGFDFIRHGRSRTYQRHLAAQYVDELRQLVQAGTPQKTA